mgnify:CR=1 FL=1
MLTWFVSGTLFSSILLFGNKYFYVSEQKHNRIDTLVITFLSYFMLFVPSLMSDCPVSSNLNDENVVIFFVFLVADFTQIITSSNVDTFVPAITAGHFIARHVKQRHLSSCAVVELSVAIVVVALSGLSVATRNYAHKKKPPRVGFKELAF